MAYVGRMSPHPNHPFAHDQISFVQKPEPSSNNSSAKPSKVPQSSVHPDEMTPEHPMAPAVEVYERQAMELAADPPLSMREIAERKNRETP